MTSTDPAAFFRDMLGEWEKMANKVGGDFARSDEFTRAMHGATAATMSTQEAISFSQLKPEFEKASAVVIGLSPDNAKKHEKFKSKYNLTIHLAADEERKVIEAYHLWVEKSMYGRKYMGVERATFLIGRDGRIARVWRKVRVKSHADEVLEAVRAL